MRDRPDEKPGNELPPCAIEYLARVTKKIRYRRRVRQDVQAELTAHFEDELRDAADAAEREQRAKRLIEEFGLAKIAGAPGYALSGGERRRVEIARCLAIMPSFLLLDEPFSGIDPIAVYDIQQMILGLRGKGYGILLTDHNVRDTLAITDRATIIHQGKIVVEGAPKEVAASEVARKYYLGDRFTL